MPPKLGNSTWSFVGDWARALHSAARMQADPPKLVFDRGTLLVEGCSAASRAEELPALVWDGRVGALRAPAYRYRELATAAEASGFRWRDSVMSCSPGTATWEPLGLRPYQHAAAAAFRLAGSRGLVVMPTGTGKTRVALALMSQCDSVLCLVPTRALLHQWREAIARFHAGPVGMLGDRERDIRPITVTTFESAYRHMQVVGNRFRLLVVDEVHHFGCGIRDEALEMCAAPERLGLTATVPGRAALGRLEELVGPVVFEQSISDLSSYLAAFELVVMRLPLNAEESARYAVDYGLFKRVFRAFRVSHARADFRDFIQFASATAEGRRALAAYRRARDLAAFTQAKARAVAELRARHFEAKMLIFTESNAAAYEITREFLVAPITCDIGRTERDQVLQAFRDGSLRCVVSSRVLNEGLDVPDADVAVVVGGSHGEREYVQRIGRLLRPMPGKRAIVYELVSAVESEERRAFVRRRPIVAASSSVSRQSLARRSG